MCLKIKYFKIFFVFFVFVYYFLNFTKKYQKAIHTLHNETLVDNPSILICVSLRKVCGDKLTKYGNFKTSIYKKETMENLVCHLSQNIPKNPKLIIEEAEKWNFLDAFQSKLNNTVKKDILMFDYHLCANYDLILNLKQSNHVFSFSFNKINVKVFIYKSGDINSFLGLDFFTFNFKRNDRKISSLIIKHIEVFNQNFNKICSLKKKKGEISSCSTIHCYQKCFKTKVNNYKFLYTKKDDLVLKLENPNDYVDFVDDECFKRCFKNFFGVYYYIVSLRFEERETKIVKFIFNNQITKIIPSYLKTQEIYILEITSLLAVLLDFNYSVFLKNCLTVLVGYFKIKKNDLVKKFKTFIFVFTTINLLISCSNMIEIYRKFFLFKTTSIIQPKTSKIFSVSSCFDVKKITNTNNSKKFILVEPLEKNNLYVLEKISLNFEKLFNISVMNFMNENRKIHIDKKSIEIFFISEISPKTLKHNIYKCFFLRNIMNQTLIRNFLSGYSLKIKFNRLISFYFLTAENFYPNSRSKKFFNSYKYITVEKNLDGDKSILKCKNYKNNCKLKVNCIDQCVFSNYSTKYLKLPMKIPIFSSHFKPEEKKLLVFDSQNTNKVLQLRTFCSKLYPLADCYNLKFDHYQTNFKNATDQIFIFGNQFARTDSEVVFINKHELIFNLLTSFNVWVGLNIPKLLKKIFVNVKRKLVLRYQFSFLENSVFRETMKFFFNLALISGLSYNLLSLSSEILKQNKIANVKYKFFTKIKYPIVTICVDYREKFNFTKKMKVNGNLLDKMTYSANDIFESIKYLDDNQQMQTLKNFNYHESNRSENILKISHFYYMKVKCFDIRYKAKIPFYFFHRNQNNSNYLSINFQPNVTKYYLTLQTKKTLNFGHFMLFYNHKNLVYFIKTTVNLIDSYTFLKQFPFFFKPKIPFNFNEAKSYSEFLKKKFKESKNLATCILPLNQEYFNLTINNKKFLHFYKKKFKKLEEENVDNSYYAEYNLRTISIRIKSKKKKLKLKPELLTVETTIEDKISVENFFLAFLNLISFWFNLSLMDILNHFLSSIKILFFSFILLLNRFLKSFKKLI